MRSLLIFGLPVAGIIVGILVARWPEHALARAASRLFAALVIALGAYFTVLRWPDSGPIAAPILLAVAALVVSFRLRGRAGHASRSHPAVCC